MALSFFSTHLSTALRTIRRHPGKLTLLTVTAGATYFASTYLRRNLNTLEASIQAERTAGANKLRTVFLSNQHALNLAYKALLIRLHRLLEDVSQLDTTPFIQRLRGGVSKDEKALVWESVRVASIVKLLVSVYLAAVENAFVTVLVYLLARYSGGCAEAPVQLLPGGELSGLVSKHVLGIANLCLDETCIESAVKSFTKIVTEARDDIPLSKRVGVNDVSGMLGKVMERAYEDIGLASLPEAWLSETLANEALLDELSVSERRNFTWLLEEALDLCDALDIADVIEHHIYTLLHASRGRLGEMLCESEEESVPFAYMFARFGTVTKELLSGEGTNAEFLLKDDETAVRFGACVFLSGEKESRGSRGVDLRELDERGEGENAENAENAENGGEDDLGLMFDMHQADAT